jgi:hypothetical protein
MSDRKSRYFHAQPSQKEGPMNPERVQLRRVYQIKRPLAPIADG